MLIFPSTRRPESPTLLCHRQFGTNRTINRRTQITKARGPLTELEGAILGVLRREPGGTAYAVRKVFSESISAEWSGSAGAVYPAIARMRAAKLIVPRVQKDGRGTVTFTLSSAGITAHDDWLCDVQRAIGPGIDPFRTRAGLWLDLPLAKRRALMKQLKTEIRRLHDAVAAEPRLAEPAEAISRDLHLSLLEMRLRWLEKNGG